VGSMELRAEHRQVQTLSPRLQHAVRLLQMSSLDFAAIVRSKLGENPFLEDEEVPADSASLLSPETGMSDFDGGDAEVSMAPMDGDDRALWQADRAGLTRRIARA
jgi:RNA polymerase sigma-54 factor